MADDSPPPKKKSRFFANGVGKIGNILPLKKKSCKEHDDAAEPGASPADDNDGPPLLASIQPLPPLMPVYPSTNLIQPRSDQGAPPSRFPPHLTLPAFPANGSDASHSRQTGQSQHPTSSPLRQAQVPDSEAETELEGSSEDEGEDAHDTSDEENAQPKEDPSHPSQHGNKKNRSRRKAIYGVQDLLPAGSSTNPLQTTPSLTRVPTVYQSLASQAQNLQQGAPPGHSYTFSGVPTNPYGTSAGGQVPFNFRPAPDLAVPTTIQQGASNLYHHLTGSGLARMAQQSTHNDTGPLRAYPAAGPSTPSQSSPMPNLNAPYVDMDRDEYGRRLQSYNPRPTAHHGVHMIDITRTPAHMQNPESLVPEHMYTSPNRIERAQQYARISLKRKRPDTILPPPSYVYQHTGSPAFNIFHGLLLYPELCFALAAQLPVNDLISLYAISKDFHVILDTRFTTVILSQAMRKSPESARTYMFRSYGHLCRNDPAARIPHPNTRLAAESIPRKIPSFRWLKMILHREKTIHELMTVFAEDGVPLPARCSLALKKLWFMLDIPDNARRVGFTHNKQLMSDVDLYFAACFFTKLDMRLNDPTAGEKRDGMRKLLLSQRSFTTVLKVLKREMWTSRFEILKEWVRLKHDVTHDDERGMDIFGVKADFVGRGKLEYWGLKTDEQAGRKLVHLMRPDQLIIREAFRRGMRFDKHYLRFLLYGYVRPDTLDDYEPRKYGRRIEEIKDEEYEVDDAVGGVAALGVDDDGFDDLLDLGQPRTVSGFTFTKEETSKGEMQLRERDEAFLNRCIEWWDNERRSAMGSE